MTPEQRAAALLRACATHAATPEDLAGMRRFGIDVSRTYGTRMPELRSLAKEAGRDHELARALWATGMREGMLLATMVGEPARVTPQEMEQWVRDISSWDVCDGLCGNLWWAAPAAYAKAEEWAGREEEFVKRTGFVLMTQLAVHDKRAPDAPFLAFLALIEREAHDGRNFVKKAVNWALRQIGKRNLALHAPACATAARIREQGTSAARWVASDALRELESAAVVARLEERAARAAGKAPRGKKVQTR